MLATSMSAKKPPPDRAAMPGATQLNIRASDDLIAKLDMWLGKLNKDRRLPLSRSELIRGVLDWAAEAHPNWEKR